MIKKIIVISIAVVLLAYVLFAIFFLNKKTGNEACINMEIVMKDSLERSFIKNKDIAVMLRNANMTPLGKNMTRINTEAIENLILKNKLIRNVECYKTTNGTVKIEIYQKIPILRVISNNGSYFVDSEGTIMPAVQNVSAYLPIATGYIEKGFATTKLYNFALFLHDDKFWNAQIEQIYVAPNQDVEITPRVGDHQIVLGQLENYKENLEKLKLFYEKGLNEVGWNRYSVINLKYKNQVVCKKK